MSQYPSTPSIPLQTPAPPTPSLLLNYPAPYTLLITINRPKAMNSLPYASHWELHTLLAWFDREPTLRIALITGSGTKAFCAGQDLIEQGRIADAAAKARAGQAQQGEGVPPPQMLCHPPSGFAAISRRQGKKPIVAAVNGFALGGGFETVLGCDMVVAAPTATFGLPEASRGLYAAAGGLARLVRVVGLPVATEIAMAGRVLKADEAKALGVVNVVSQTRESVVEEAVKLAARIAELSPDAVIVTRAGLRMALEVGSVEVAAQKTEEIYGTRMREAENIRIGLEAFAKKQKPQWVPSKL